MTFDFENLQNFNVSTFHCCAIIVFSLYFPPLTRFLSADVLFYLLPHPTCTCYLMLIKPIVQTFCLRLRR